MEKLEEQGKKLYKLIRCRKCKEVGITNSLSNKTMVCCKHCGRSYSFDNYDIILTSLSLRSLREKKKVMSVEYSVKLLPEIIPEVQKFCKTKEVSVEEGVNLMVKMMLGELGYLRQTPAVYINSDYGDEIIE